MNELCRAVNQNVENNNVENNKNERKTKTAEKRCFVKGSQFFKSGSHLMYFIEVGYCDQDNFEFPQRQIPCRYSYKEFFQLIFRVRPMYQESLKTYSALKYHVFRAYSKETI